MRSPSDPIRALRRRAVAEAVIAAIAVGAALVWSTFEPSLRPLGELAPAPPPAGRAARPVIDPSIFEGTLWPAGVGAPPAAPVVAVAEPTPQAPPVKPPEPPPKAMLIALVADPLGPAKWRAAMHDARADRLLLLAPGDRLGAWSLTTIEDGAARFEDGEGRSVLYSLREGSR